MLANALDKLDASQTQATQAAAAARDRPGTDISSVVMSVEQASLELQLAVQIRNKLVDAYQDIFRMQV